MKSFIIICGVILLAIVVFQLGYPIFKHHIFPEVKTVREIKFVIMDETSYYREYEKSFDSDASPKIITDEELEAEFYDFDERLRKALSKKWGKITENEYETFEVSYEWSRTFHHCGGVYHKAIYSPEYVKTIVEVIASLPHAEYWTYHTACEASDLPGIGGFFIRNSTVYAPKDGYDYVKYLGTENSPIEYFQADEPMINMREAVIDKDLELVKTLLETSPELVNSRDNLEYTPLHHAVESGYLEMIEYLIERGADIHAQNFMEWTPLHKACSEDDRLSIIHMLLEAGANIESATNDGQTPLHIAAFRNRIATTRLLLDMGANVNGVGQGIDTPLYEAIMQNHLEIAKFLIQRGADVNAKGVRGRTPLHHAADWGRVEMCKLLVAHGADLNSVDEEGKTPLALSIYGSKELVYRFLREQGAKE